MRLYILYIYKLDRRQKKNEKERKLADGRGGRGWEGVGEEPNHTTASMPSPIINSFNALGSTDMDSWPLASTLCTAEVYRVLRYLFFHLKAN
jgi:hypothetical protein